MGSLLDRLRLEVLYRRRVGRRPNFSEPVYFTEKLQVAKLTWRAPRMVELADKVLAKQIVADKLGPEWVTPTLYAGAQLPPPPERTWQVPFVIKANHRSGANHFVRAPEDLDWDVIEAKVADWLHAGYAHDKVEWAYRPIKRQVLVEPFIGGDNLPVDIRMYVFGGETKFISVNWDRYIDVKRAVFDPDWNRMPFTFSRQGPHYGDDVPARPSSLPEMIHGAEILAEGFPFVRIDFYEIDGRPRFSEVTFYPTSGLFRMDEEWDRRCGALFPPGRPS